MNLIKIILPLFIGTLFSSMAHASQGLLDLLKVPDTQADHVPADILQQGHKVEISAISGIFPFSEITSISLEPVKEDNDVAYRAKISYLSKPFDIIDVLKEEVPGATCFYNMPQYRICVRK